MLFSAPTALDQLRQAFRQILIDVERACLSLAFGGNLKMIEMGNIGEVLKQTEKLAKVQDTHVNPGCQLPQGGNCGPSNRHISSFQ